MKQMLEKNPIDRELKNINPIEWTRLMNNYTYLVEEIVLNELIYWWNSNATGNFSYI